MTGLWGLDQVSTRQEFAYGIELALKATGLIALALVLHLLLGRRRVLSRSALWNAVLLSLLILPAAVAIAPRLQIRCLPAAGAATGEVAPARASDENPLLANNQPAAWAEPRSATPSAPEPAVFGKYPGPPSQPAQPQAGAVSGSEGKWARAWPLSRLGWADMALLAYATGSLFLALRLFGSLLAVTRLVRRSPGVDDPAWTKSLECWRKRLRIHSRVRIVSSPQVTVPIVVGVLRSTIVLPRDLAIGPRHVDAVLLHELAHVKRADYAWNLVLRLVQLIYWPHPLAWVVGPAVTSVREQACDEVCVHGLGGATSYRSTLLDIAAARLRRPRPALGMAMARTCKLARRLAWIDVSPGRSDCVLRWPWRTGLVATSALATAILGAAQLARASTRADEPQKAEQPKAAAPAEQPLAPGIAEILVTDHDTGKPIKSAFLRAAINFERVRFQTDSRGIARIDLSGGLLQEALSIDVWAEGYAQQRFFFSNIDTRYPRVPGRYQVELLPGTESFGGVVKNQEGKPIAGATVALWGWLAEKKDPNELAYMVEATTDAQGRWRTKSLRTMRWVYLYLSHPDYLADGTYHPRRFGDSAAPPPSFDSLRKGTDEQVMSRGVEVRGRVLDDGGKPLPGTTVGWFENEHTFFDDLSKTTTDANGRFRFLHARPGKLHLLAKAKAHAPDIVTIQAAAETKPVEFRLGPGRVMEGVVLDHENQPIAGAFVNADTWRGFRCLGVYLNTDQTGRFLWVEAPPDDVQMNASKPGYSILVQQRASVADRRIVFRLQPSLTINGKITDAATGEQIRDPLTVEVGTPDPKTGLVAWAERQGGFAFQGNLQASLDASAPATYLLRISGTGYEPVISRKFRSEERFLTYDVKLTKKPADDRAGPAGVLLGPDGKPIAGAKVYLSISHQRNWLTLNQGQLANPKTFPAVETGSDGRFRLPAVETEKTYEILALTDTLYALARSSEFAKDPILRAQPWGRVEGRLLVGAKPAGGQRVYLGSARAVSSQDHPVLNSDEATTDADGHFAFHHVLPGHVLLAHRMGTGKNSQGSRGFGLFEVKPGTTTEVKLGGTGRPVVGRVAAPEGFGRNVDFSSGFELEIQSNRPDSYIPREALTGDDVLNAMFAAADTPEARDHRNHATRVGQVKLAPDGSFRVEDLPAGQYRLTLAARAPAGISGKGERVAALVKFFRVPEMTGGRSDEALDLGKLDSWYARELRPGDAAPLFEIQTLNGQPLRLKDFRGKHVLLNFWAPWNDQSLFQIPYLKKLEQEFGGARFAIINLVPDDDPVPARNLAQEVKLPGALGYLGQWSDSPVIKAYGVEYLPRTFLIGPDGKILEGGTRFWMTQFRDAVAKALGQER